MKAAIIIDIDEEYFDSPILYADVKITCNEDVMAIHNYERIIPLPKRKDTSIKDSTRYAYRCGYNKCLEWLGVDE